MYTLLITRDVAFLFIYLFIKTKTKDYQANLLILRVADPDVTFCI